MEDREITSPVALTISIPNDSFMIRAIIGDRIRIDGDHVYWLNPQTGIYLLTLDFPDTVREYSALLKSQ